MSNSNIFKDFYQVPNVTFDISKLRDGLKKVLKESKYQTLGITNFHARPMNKIPGDDSSVSGHNVRGVYWTKPDETGKEVMRDKPIDESQYTELVSEFKNTYFEIILVSLNDLLVKKYLENEIQYASIHILLLKLIKISFFKKYYNSKPKNIKDIKNMVNITNQYLKKYLIKHDYINKKY